MGCACCFEVLFGISHWIFVMNYLTLAIRIKYYLSDQFQTHIRQLNILYYGFGALNVCVPIIAVAIARSSHEGYKFLLIIVQLLWIFTVGVLYFALSILNKSLNAKNNVAVNFKEMMFHFGAFAIFVFASVYVMIIAGIDFRL